MKNVILIISSCIIVLGFNSCKHPTGPYDQDKYLPPPSCNTSAEEIRTIERISTIHFVDVHTLFILGDTVTSYEEYYFDSTRMKMIVSDDHKNILLLEVAYSNKSIGWVYQSRQIIYPPIPNDYNLYVQIELGSWLNEPLQRIGHATLDGRDCEIITDSTKEQEWIWADHRMPIQRYSAGFLYKKIQIEQNQVFPDSLFEPPK